MIKDEKIFTAILDVTDTVLAALTAFVMGRLLLGYDSGAHIVLFAATLSLLYRIADLNVPPLGGRRYLSCVIIANLIFSLVSALVYTMRFGIDGNRAIAVCALGMTVLGALLLLKRRVAELIAGRIFRMGGREYRVLIVGDNLAVAMEFIKRIDSSYTSLRLVGAVGDALSSLGCRWYGALSELPDALRAADADFAVFAVKEYREREVARLISECEDNCTSVYFLPVIYGVFRSERQIAYISDMPLVDLHATPMSSPFASFLKRGADIVISLILIVITSPIMLLLALGVRLSSRGPILFRQRRVGLYGREFTMYKFRSMREGEGALWSTGVDARKTRFGNFMRRTSLDELPQLFNVLRGEMSLVGPRPEQPCFVERFKLEIPLYMLKHYVKPGMTGLAQIRGLRGDSSIARRIESDIEYIQSWTLLSDIKILLMTPFRVINKSEKYKE